MAWGRFALGLVLVLVMQVSLVRFVGVPALDLFLAYALLVAFTAPVSDARIAGFVVGLTQDLGSDVPLGVHAFALGLAATILTLLRGFMQSVPFWVRWLGGTLAGLGALVLLSLYAVLWRGGQVDSWARELQLIALTAAVAAGIAAYLAPGTTHRGRLAAGRR